MSTLTPADLTALRAPFPKDRLCVKVQSLNREKSRAMLVLYLQHTDVQARLDEVDPSWTCEVVSEERAGETLYVRMRMTVKGVWRENVGEGQDPKSAYSDAIKRCAMLFGVGRYLYDQPTVWVDYNESQDRYREWSVNDFEQVAKPVQAPAPAPKPAVRPRATSKPRAAASAQAPGPREFTKTAPVAPRVATPATAGPMCCGLPMQVNRYNPNQIQCSNCKFKRKREPAVVMPSVGEKGH